MLACSCMPALYSRLRWAHLSKDALHAGEKGEATALDLGCSVGGTAFELRQIFPIVVGVDPDPIRIDLAKVGAALHAKG